MSVSVPTHTADGTSLPAAWHTVLPVRWMLNPAKTHHCDACLSFAGEYASWEKMLETTNGAAPGFFPACVRPSEMQNAGQLVACWDACQCSVDVNLDGEWKRVH